VSAHTAMPGPTLTSLVDLLRRRADEQPDDRAYVFLSERGIEQDALTFAELQAAAQTLAVRLAKEGERGSRALLLFPPGLEFLIGFFGCMQVGIIPVPLMLPRRNSLHDSSAAVVADCLPKFALTSAGLLAGPRSDVMTRFQSAGIACIAVDRTADAGEGELANLRLRLPEPQRDDLAFLQYTSGSTSAPKGVMVSHGNLLDNSEMIRLALGNTRRSTYVSWVPLYHDMGLILNALQALYVGATCVLLAPAGFIQRPLTWLRAIHAYKAEVAGAPNFAFDLCVDRFRPEQMTGVDLSGWKLAFNAAEPVRAESMQRFARTFAPYGFRAEALYPLYGLAEATLLVSAGRRASGVATRVVSRRALQDNRVAPAESHEDAHALVGCGECIVGERLAIVDRESRRRLPPEKIGEVWVNGPHVAKGYWHNAGSTAATFEARIAGAEEREETHWLRTGDLGFLDENGELYITGRIKDVIIIRGINHYPQDIERTAQASHGALRRDGGAAFAVPGEDGSEKLVVVHEVERTRRHNVVPEEIAACIREAVVNEHELAVHDIALIRAGSIPKTTSGKIQRSKARQLWRQGLLERLE
jgi:acyl-CoA synthetase (AMP-forming)/AMP-acid ligase II